MGLQWRYHWSFTQLAFCEGTPPVIGGSPHKGPVLWKGFPWYERNWPQGMGECPNVQNVIAEDGLGITARYYELHTKYMEIWFAYYTPPPNEVGGGYTGFALSVRSHETPLLWLVFGTVGNYVAISDYVADHTKRFQTISWNVSTCHMVLIS